MSVTDPIADMLTSIRNAQQVGMEMVQVPHSRIKSEIARVLKKEGYVTDFVVEGGAKRTLRVYLKYTEDQEPAIQGVTRVSRSGLREYADADNMPRVLRGLGTAIVTTSRGIMTDKEARRMHVGGEVLCNVW
mgnify:CR=1 FL=1